MLSFDLVCAALTLELGGREPFETQRVTIDAFMAYQRLNLKIGYWGSNPHIGIPEPLIISLGRGAGATTLHRALKRAHPELVVTVGMNSHALELTKLDFGEHTTDRKIVNQIFDDKIVIFDGAYNWHTNEAQERVRYWVANGGPKYVAFLGS
jgi:hypothetical protein